MSIPSVVNLTLLYNNLRDVIPTKAGRRPIGPPSGVEPPLGWNLARRESRLPPAQREKTGFRIKSGMTKCVKSFMKHYTITFRIFR